MTPSTNKAWLDQVFEETLEHTIEQFGVERCLFESNFPVDMVSRSYKVLWNSFKRLTGKYSADEKKFIPRYGEPRLSTH